MPSNEIPNLGEFFSLIGGERKKKQEELDSLVGDLSGILSELDKASKQTKEVKEQNKKEGKKNKIKKDIKDPNLKTDVNSLFAELASLKKQEEEKKEKELREAKLFENWLFSEEPKVEHNAKKAVKVLEQDLLNLKNTSYESIDRLMKGICAEYNITTTKLHNEFKEKHGIIPDEWIKRQKKEDDIDETVEVSKSPIIDPDTTNYDEWIEEEIAEEESEEIEDKVDESVEKSIEILDKLIPEEEKLTEEDDEISSMKREIAQLRKMVYQSIQAAAAQGGGGEVRLEFMDDIDRDSAKVNDKYLKYNSSTGKWEGADAGGLTSLGPLTEVAGLSTTAIENGAVLEFNASTGQFIATSKSAAGISTITTLTGLDDVVGTATTNDVLIFNGTDFTFQDPFYVVDLSDGVQDGGLDVGIYT